MALPSPRPHPSRFVAFCGTCNARDLGGLPLTRGGATRRGRYYRSDAPLRADETDTATFERLGITTIIDLREPHEIVREPSSLAGERGIAVHQVDIWSGVRNARRASGAPSDPWDLGALYAAAIDHSGPDFVRALAILADADGAALFHCTVGKDRTGLLAALLLESVGVPRAAIVDDYVLTHDRIDGVRARLLAQGQERGVRPEDYARLLGATPDLIERFLSRVDDAHGGVRTYLERSGAPSTLVARLAQRLT
jgi:protein-tyrosine phosphatase